MSSCRLLYASPILGAIFVLFEDKARDERRFVLIIPRFDVWCFLFWDLGAGNHKGWSPYRSSLLYLC